MKSLAATKEVLQKVHPKRNKATAAKKNVTDVKFSNLNVKKINIFITPNHAAVCTQGS